MAVTAYNDWLSDLLRNVECVLAFDTAADFLGLEDTAHWYRYLLIKGKKLKEQNRF